MTDAHVETPVFCKSKYTYPIHVPRPPWLPFESKSTMVTAPPAARQMPIILAHDAASFNLIDSMPMRRETTNVMHGTTGVKRP